MITPAELQAHGIHLHAIVAMSENRVIGKDGDLPWRLSEDLKLFKKRTMGSPIIMGRATFESLPKKRPLPGRRNIVLSGTMKAIEGVDVITTINDLPSLGISGPAFLIGGAKVFESLLAYCESLYLTYVYGEIDGDTFLPPFENDFRFVRTLEKFPEFEVRLYESSTLDYLRTVETK